MGRSGLVSVRGFLVTAFGPLPTTQSTTYSTRAAGTTPPIPAGSLPTTVMHGATPVEISRITSSSLSPVMKSMACFMRAVLHGRKPENMKQAAGSGSTTERLGLISTVTQQREGRFASPMTRCMTFSMSTGIGGMTEPAGSIPAEVLPVLPSSRFTTRNTTFSLRRPRGYRYREVRWQELDPNRQRCLQVRLQFHSLRPGPQPTVRWCKRKWKAIEIRRREMDKHGWRSIELPGRIP